MLLRPLALQQQGYHLLLHGVLGLESLQLLRGRAHDVVGRRHVLLISAVMLARRHRVKRLSQ